ncbi:MAG: hypothetical protein AB8C46_16375 [Burkholderiaceae bacterium]
MAGVPTALPETIGRGEIEYSKTIDYIHHLYETRGKIFQFAVALNTGLLVIVFQWLTESIAKLGMSAVGFALTLTMMFMAARSWRYLQELEKYACELELALGFSLVTTTSRRMPKGLDSTHYLLFIFAMFVLMWLALGANYSLRLFDLPAL